VSEPGRERAELARRLGAIVVDPRTEDPVTVSRAATAGRGVDISFDAAGFSDETFRSAYDALRNGGRCVIVARVHHDVPVDLAGFLVHEKTVTGSYAYRDEDFDQVIDAIARGTIDPLVLVSSRIPLEDVIARGFDHLLGEGRSTELKILVAPGGPGMTRTSTASPRRDAER
jgi:(R,R)-butanediol dehydrogenase/meso-butanediol dehydrogenase/diacetyl reductase